MIDEVKVYSCQDGVMKEDMNDEYVSKKDFLDVVTKLHEAESNCFSAIDMATAASNGFVDGVASISKSV